MEDVVTSAEHTAEETTLRTSGQRRINMLWEVTQAIIALETVTGTIWLTVAGSDVSTTLSSMTFLIIGFYFARTNHQATGGVGPTLFPDQRR